MRFLPERRVILTGASGQLGQQWMDGLPQIQWIACDEKDGIDVRNSDQLKALLETYGVPDGLVCAAAIDAKPGTPGCGPFEALSLEDWQQTLDVNLTGVMLCCQVFGTAMAQRRKGSIVLVSSIYGMAGPDQRRYEAGFVKPIAYSATKAALYGLARWLAVYWGPQGVRVNCVTFGSMDRPDYSSSFREAFTNDVPMGRFAWPGEFAGILEFLLSDASSYVTGANFVVDGGYLAR